MLGSPAAATECLTRSMLRYIAPHRRLSRPDDTSNRIESNRIDVSAHHSHHAQHCSRLIARTLSTAGAMRGPEWALRLHCSACRPAGNRAVAAGSRFPFAFAPHTPPSVRPCRTGGRCQRWPHPCLHWWSACLRCRSGRLGEPDMTYGWTKMTGDSHRRRHWQPLAPLPRATAPATA